ncbi:hypothetical protein [Nonlabens sp. Asnod3-A02]|uniref:hypothetical protein n=1 Tax=Nonlabens sp. Asnod3-A02 TaxID=3160579 RepID=UPI003870CA68
MKLSLYIFSFFIFLFTNTSLAQSNDFEAAGYSIGIGTVFTTVGAIINKDKEEKVWDVIKKRWWQGAVGGYLQFESKRILREVDSHDQWPLFWSSKIVNEMGSSIQHNAAYNQPFGRYWYFNIAFNRIEIDTKDRWQLKYKLRPIDFLFTTDAAIRYNFEFQESLRYGHPVFTTGDSNLNGQRAYASAGYLVRERNENSISLIKHEFVHVLQNNEYSILNTYYQPFLDIRKDKNKFYKWLNSNLYIEAHYIPLRGLYLLETWTAENYTDNFFEMEADYFSGFRR